MQIRRSQIAIILLLSIFVSSINFSRTNTYAADANPFPNISGLVARYLPSGYVNTSSTAGIWVSTTGSDTATVTLTATSDVQVGTSSGANGASNSFPVLTGNHNSKISWPNTILGQANYTFLYVARYNSSVAQATSCSGHTSDSNDYRNRIFSGATVNWLSGFWNCYPAVAFHNGWLTNQPSTQSTVIANNWLLGTDCGYSATYTFPNYCSGRYRAQGKDITDFQSTDTSIPYLRINQGVTSTEISDYQIAELIVINGTLSISDSIRMETYLARNYGITLKSGSASKLGVYTSTNGGSVATYGSTFTTQPQIVVRDSDSQTVNSDTGTIVTASVSSGGVLLGTVTAPTINGIATFSNLGLYGTPGATYTITYTASGLISTTETIQMAGTAIAGTAAILSSSPTNKLGSVTLTASVNRPATVTFYWNNRIINRCGSVLTSGTVPNLTAICAWKPLVHGQQSVRAVAVPSDSGFTTATSNTLNLVIGKRAGTR
jgi:hypothetical protein